jgi:predicted HD phosphohydrolase
MNEPGNDGEGVTPVRGVLLLLGALEDQGSPFAVTQLDHALQTATRAERAGASAELVVAALCHDMCKALPHRDHGRVAAEILRPFVSDETYWVVRAHQRFQARFLSPLGAGAPDARERYRHQPWYSTAARFAEEWDYPAFEQGGDALPLEHFVPTLEAVFSTPRPVMLPWWRRLVGRVPRGEAFAQALGSRLD